MKRKRCPMLPASCGANIQTLRTPQREAFYVHKCHLSFPTTGGVVKPDCDRTAGTPWGAHSSGSCPSIATVWLALFGPRPSFIFSTRRLENDWQQWDEGDRHHGLARFEVGCGGWLDSEPVQAIPRKKPCWASSQPWGQR